MGHILVQFTPPPHPLKKKKKPTQNEQGILLEQAKNSKITTATVGASYKLETRPQLLAKQPIAPQAKMLQVKYHYLLQTGNSTISTQVYI